MGANGSSEQEFGVGRGKYGVSNLPPGKPSVPEGIPKITDITHNSISLNWLSPMNSGQILAYQVECCNLKDRKWRVITSTCQGTTYHVRNLIPETYYAFRVRAENVLGQSKPSHVSDEIKTRPVPTNYLEEKPKRKLVRRHSHYLKIEGGVNTLLNRTEDQPETVNSVGNIPFRRNSMRGSLPPTLRKKRNSVTSMLPGTKRESVCNLKESNKSCEDPTILEEEGLNLKRISTSSTEASSIFSATSMTSIVEDEELRILYGQRDCTMCSDNDDTYSTTNSHSTTSSQCSSRSSHSSCTHNPLQSNSNFLTAAITDKKLDNYSNSDNADNNRNSYISDCLDGTNNITTGKTIFDVCENENEIWKGRIDHDSESKTLPSNHRNSNRNTGTLDLRSLRQLLNSQDVMVKTLDSCGVDNIRRTHSAIKELDEECITMDIVSTI